jgi:hypothetical protein
MKRLTAGLALCRAMLGLGAARADAPSTPAPATPPTASTQSIAAPSRRFLSVTWEAYDVVEPLVTFAGELRLADSFTLQLALGGGSGRVSKSVSVDTGDRAPVLLGQLRGRWYFTGDFGRGGFGLQLEAGAPIWLARGPLWLSHPVGVGVVPPGLTVSPMLAIKYVVPMGVTLDTALGLQWNALDGPVPRGAFVSSDALQFAARFGAGWTF